MDHGTGGRSGPESSWAQALTLAVALHHTLALAPPFRLTGAVHLTQPCAWVLLSALQGYHGTGATLALTTPPHPTLTQPSQSLPFGCHVLSLRTLWTWGSEAVQAFWTWNIITTFAKPGISCKVGVWSPSHPAPPSRTHRVGRSCKPNIKPGWPPPMHPQLNPLGSPPHWLRSILGASWDLFLNLPYPLHPTIT